MVEASNPTSSASTKPLPPGMIIGPDGKPCKICTAWRNLPRTTKAKQQSPNKSQPMAMAGAVAAVSATVTAQDSKDSDPVRPENCPPDVEQLGRATWTFLHTTAAYYPEKPTPNQRANMLTLLRALPIVYACSHCATHLGDNMQGHPPDVSGRLGLSRWLCERHNEVNERLGKTKFDCALPKLDERWKDGPQDGSCD